MGPGLGVTPALATRAAIQGDVHTVTEQESGGRGRVRVRVGLRSALGLVLRVGLVLMLG